MAPGVCFTVAVTPSLPRPPRPQGQLAGVPLATFSTHTRVAFARQSFQMNLVPDPPERGPTNVPWARRGRAVEAHLPRERGRGGGDEAESCCEHELPHSETP